MAAGRPPASQAVDADIVRGGLPGHTAEVGESLADSRALRQDSRREDIRRRDEALALTAFEEANGGRVATPAEVRILRQLAGQLDPAAGADPELATGWAWIGAAVYEAVDAGSAYVAPRRIREIATRWQREGRPGASSRPADAPAAPEIPPAMLGTRITDRGDAVAGPNTVAAAGGTLPSSGAKGARPSPRTTRSLDPAPGPTLGSPPVDHDAASHHDVDPTLDGPALWDAVLRELARDIDPAHLAELAAEVQVARVTMDEVELTATPTTAAALAGEARPHLTRALSAVLRRTVRLTIRPATAPRPEAPTSEAPEAGPAAEMSTGPTDTSLGQTETSLRSTGASLGLTDAHLWAAVVDEVVRAGDVTPANVAAWLRPARITGRTPAGAHVVVAPSDIARRRLDGPLRPALEAALARVLGPAARLEIIQARETLR